MRTARVLRQGALHIGLSHPEDRLVLAFTIASEIGEIEPP